MDRVELLKLNKTIDTFFADYGEYFQDVVSTFSVEDYLDAFYEYHGPIKPVQFKGYYTYTGEILRQYKDKVVLTYQPSDAKNGFMGIIIQINPKVHMIAQVGAEFREDDMSTVGINPVFVSFDGMSPAIKWMDDNAEHIHAQVYQNEHPSRSAGFGHGTALSI